MARPDGPRGGAVPRPPMPGGGGIGLPLAPRRGGAGVSDPPSVGPGAEGASTGGATAGGAEAAGAGGAAAGGAEAAGAGAGTVVGAGGSEAAGAGGTGAGAESGAMAEGRTGSSSRRRGVRGRSLPLEVTSRAGGRGATGAGVGAGTSAGVDSTTGTGAGGGAGASATGVSTGEVAAFFVTLAALAGSSGWTSRTSPSRSALRRTRSAWASSMLEECVLTPIPSSLQRSSVSLLVNPSSLASSCTRFFAAKFLVQSFGVCLRGRGTASWPHHGRPFSHVPGGRHDSEPVAVRSVNRARPGPGP